MKYKLFEYSYTKGNVEYYKPNPNLEMYIRAISLETGEIAYKKILEYTIHNNLTMYKVIDKKENRFEPFWVSDDHSLVIYDKYSDELRKISPKEILKNKNRYYLIQCKENGKFYYNLIHCLDLKFELDHKVTTAADFTVEDYYTFSTADGIFVQDTMAVFHPLSDESQQEIKEKMANIHAATSFSEFTKSLSKDFIFGLYVLTK